MRLFAEFRERLRALLFRRREERELAEELDFHLQSTIEKNIRRGMSPTEARRQAALTLGGIERVKEEVRDARGTRFFENLIRDIRLASRRLMREAGFAIPMLVTIALGIGVATAVFMMVNAILVQPLPYPDADRLVDVRHAAPGAELSVTGLSPGLFLHYRDHNRSFESMAVYLDYASTLTDIENPEQVRAALVTSSLFDVLGIPPYLGRLPSTSQPDGDAELLISHELWERRYGGDPTIVGRTVEMDRRQAVVVGVARPGFAFPRRDVHVWMTGRMDELLARFSNSAGLGGLYLKGVARLQQDVPVDAAERDLDRLIAALPDAFPDVTAAELDDTGLHAVLVPLKDVVVGDVRPALLLLAATAGFLLLITWANAANLSLLRAERLCKEVAVQRALGATHGRLIQRFSSEGVVLATLAGGLGFVLAVLAVGVGFGFDSGQIARLQEVGVDIPAGIFAASLVLMTAVLVASVSLSSVRNTGLGDAGRVTTGPGAQTGRRLLVVGQVALALTLLIGSALMVESYRRLARVDIGFRPDGALSFLLPVPAGPYPGQAGSARVHRDVLARLRAVPGVEAVEAATTAAFPLTPVPDHYTARVTIAEAAVADTALAPRAIFSFATPGYFRAIGIPLVQGRTFRETATPGSSEAILSAALARQLFAGANPIGRRVSSAQTGDVEHLVVGVVGDVPSRTIRDGGTNVLYLANVHSADTAATQGVALRDEQYVVRTSLPPTSIVPTIRRGIDEVDPKLLMARVGTLDDLVSDSLAQDRVTMLLLVVGAVTALVLGLIGIYGVLSYAVGRRQAELGVRIALGASPRGIVGMVVRQGAVLALSGIALGLAAALGLSRFLTSLLYEVSPNDTTAFAGTAGLLFLVALVASYVPARRAGRIDPVETIRTE